MLVDHFIREQLHLQVHGHFADLVEKDRAVVRRREEAWAGLRGAGEGALHVPEELAFEERVRDGSPQLIGTNGCPRRGLAAWIARATSSLPVPLSPVMSTLLTAGPVLAT